ncbi:MAG: hypothetical protein ACRCZP_13055 [Phycicoccus sp.]
MPPPLLLRPAATPIDWEIIKGETFSIEMPVLDANDTPVLVGGWSVRAQVRRSERDPVVHEWSTALGNAAASGTTVTLAVVGAVTTTWAWSDGLLSIEVTEPASGPTHVIALGRVRALPEITR